MLKKKRIDYLSFTLENDLPSRRGIGYREMKIFGWFCMLCLILGAILANNLVLTITQYNTGVAVSGQIFSFFGDLALPAFFIANFSIILNNRDNYKSIFKKYSLFIGIIFVVLYLFLFRYILMVTNKAYQDTAKSFQILTDLLNANPTFGVCFNIFIDLMLCLLCWFFIDYTPKKHFQNKKLIIFRLLVILPIAYELTCMCLKIYSAATPEFKFPFYVFPLLTNKPPILFFVFLAIAIREKVIERKYMKLGHTRDEFLSYCKTNAASKTFSRFACIVFLIAFVIDTIFYITIVNIWTNKVQTVDTNFILEMIRIGLGKGTALIGMIPLMLFYRYNKTYKRSSIDIIIPIVSIIAIAVIVIESILDILLTRL